MAATVPCGQWCKDFFMSTCPCKIKSLTVPKSSGAAELAQPPDWVDCRVGFLADATQTGDDDARSDHHARTADQGAERRPVTGISSHHCVRCVLAGAERAAVHEHCKGAREARGPRTESRDDHLEAHRLSRRDAERDAARREAVRK